MERGPISFLVRAGRLAQLAYEEGRLPLSPRRWWADLRHLRGVMAAERAQALKGDHVHERVAGLQSRPASSSARTRDEFRSFLAGNTSLGFARPENPTLSIVVVLAGDPALSYRCLRSFAPLSAAFELVLAGHVSCTEGEGLVSRIENALIALSDATEGFAAAANRGAEAARASDVLFLDGRLELYAGAIEAVTAALASSPDVGVAGARLLRPDGRLGEAGRIVWRDGTIHVYGDGGSPLAPQYSFTRDVDACSAELLMTRRALFVGLGGFDPIFGNPADAGADYCVRVWESGARVVYEPAAIAMQHVLAEPSQSAPPTAAVNAAMVQKHAGWLARQAPADLTDILSARAHQQRGQRIVVFDDRVPHEAIGLGFPRSLELLRALTELGHFVTFYPLSFTTENWPSVYADIPRSIEVMTDYGPSRLDEFWSARHGYYDTAIVSRHHNMQRMRSRLGDPAAWGVRVIYDAEALVAFLRVSQSQMAGERLDERRAIDEEIQVAQGVDAVLSVSEQEADAFRSRTNATVVMVRHAVVPDPTERSFSDRHGLLFVGAFDPLSPNADSVLWFVRNVLPRLEQLLHAPVPFTIVGHNMPGSVRTLAASTITVVADAADVRPFYDAARLFVAPTRFAAGIPLKVVHAVAHGLPVVCTSLLARQLGWTGGSDLMTADSPDTFASCCASVYTNGAQWLRLRANSSSRLVREYSPEIFAASLTNALESGARSVPSRRVTATDVRGIHR